MLLESWLPQGGTNLFQGIKAMKDEVKARGLPLIDLSIGQPEGPALLSARKAAAEAVMSDKESMHEYQDNGSPGVPDFARRFVNAHLPINLEGETVDYLPIPGIKPMLGLIPLACGIRLRGHGSIVTTTNPGYPTPRDWAEKYLGRRVNEPLLSSLNNFRPRPEDFGTFVGLAMVNYPHNPTGQIATQKWWQELCDYCCEKGIRIFNDAAYAALIHDEEGFEKACTLSEVAINFPNLSWIEAFSASKVIANGTGWRIGAMVGSPDFIADVRTIKGNTDSGFSAPLATGVLAAVELDQESIASVRALYKERLETLGRILKAAGMKLAVRPGAGFFTLWKSPLQAFGERMENAEQFNRLMIERTGIAGVQFEPYIRYSVTKAFDARDIKKAFETAHVSYEPIPKESPGS